MYIGIDTYIGACCVCVCVCVCVCARVCVFVCVVYIGLAYMKLPSEQTLGFYSKKHPSLL